MIKQAVFQRKRFVLLVTAWMVVAMPMLGQQAANGAKTAVYEVAAIKVNKAGGHMRMMDTPDGLYATNYPLKMLIETAYNLKMDDQLSGLPGWADSARFDIEAKMDEGAQAALKKLPEEEMRTQLRLMMRALLEDRFQLRVHSVTKELPMYTLVIAKGGFKLKDADPKNTYPNGIKAPDGTSHGGMMSFDGRNLRAQAIPISGLANLLSRFVSREVVDKTGLTGKYDFTLSWSPEENEPPASPGGAQNAVAMSDTGPSIFTALQEQLGLKLESTKGSVDTVVVDHIEMPSEN